MVTVVSFVLLGGVLSIVVGEVMQNWTNVPSSENNHFMPNSLAIFIMAGIQMILLIADLVINLVGINNLEHKVTQILLNKLLCCAIAAVSLCTIVVCSVDPEACFVKSCTNTQYNLLWLGFIASSALFNLLKLLADLKCIKAAHRLNQFLNMQKSVEPEAISKVLS